MPLFSHLILKVHLEVLLCQYLRKELTQKLEMTVLSVISQAVQVSESIFRGAVLHIKEYTG